MGEARRERLLRILRAATAQSLGLRLPELRGPVPFTSLLEALRGFEAWVAHGPRRPGPDPDPAPAANLPPILVVGPEGGLTDLEVETLVAGGARLLDLGPRRLRAETAAIAGLAVLGARLRAAASTAGAR
jgi:16S rRNA (uracil1498-N3)-methyltransferase